VIQGAVLFAAVVVLVMNLLVDLSYSYFNPKLRSR
jgi:ABC-type dipeptide/oligopeptide/nickel transport system permease component